MAYKTILTYLPSKSAVEATLDIAIPLARAHGAHIIGLNVIPQIPSFFLDGMYTIAPSTVIEQQRRTLHDEADAIGATFTKRAESAGLMHEWRVDDNHAEDVVEAVAKYGRSADLIVMHQPRFEQYTLWSDMHANITLAAGRPVLMAPLAGGHRDVGKRIVVAWNGSREAARAAFDALPLLKTAEDIMVLWIDPDPNDASAPFSPGEHLARGLSRHGIQVDVRVATSDDSKSTMEVLRDYLDITKADLLVMGCYGHSRFREMVFGGLSRDILEKMPVPVLMSH